MASLFQLNAETMTKRCSKCKEVKSATEFYKNRARPDGLHHYCKPCSKEAIDASDKAHPEKKTRRTRTTTVKRKYGLTLEEFDTMMWDQNGKCPICGGEIAIPDVDTDPDTGKARALLCGTCFKGLTLFKRSTEQLLRAISYLDSFKSSGLT